LRAGVVVSAVRIAPKFGAMATFSGARHKNALNHHHCVALMPLLRLETPSESDGSRAALQSGSFE
jgi:hypothetical protein